MTPSQSALWRPLRVGDRLLDGNLALAPMAGITDAVFREICREQGVSLTCTELVSARGIRYDPELQRSWRYLHIPEGAGPTSIQLFGTDPEDFAFAVGVLLEQPRLRQMFSVDLNMGCPVKKVVRTGAGSALMRTPDLAAKITEAAVRVARPAGIPVTVKFRSGWDPEHLNAASFARLMQDAGAAALTVHARTADQMYAGSADWSVISEVCQAVRIPVWGNGDATGSESAVGLLRQTGADGVAVGRAARGNPWVFGRIRAAMSGVPLPEPPDPEQRMAMVLREATARVQALGETAGMREMRKVTVWYLKDTPHAAALRRRAVTVRTLAELRELLEAWRLGLDPVPSGT